MRKWFAHDRNGRNIYLTEEQWAHIVSGHRELQNHLEDVLNTVRHGRRQQQPTDPNTYVYRRRCDSLRVPYNGILVVVAFRQQEDSRGMMAPNNFIVTAWGIMMRTRGKKR